MNTSQNDKTIKQLKHIQTINQKHLFPLVVICENLHSPQNVGMIFRISEIMGVQHLYLTGTTPAPPNAKLAKTARSAQKKIPFTQLSEASTTLIALKKEGYSVIGLEITNQSKDIHTFDFKSIEKIALVVGAENGGISATILKQLDQAICIPMFGQLSSLNVATALSIGLYEITKQWYSK